MDHIELGDAEGALRAIGEGADIDAGNPSWLDYTALHMAAMHGHVRVAKLLIEAGAVAGIPCRDGATAMHLAGSAEMLELLQAAVGGRHVDDSQNTPEQRLCAEQAWMADTLHAEGDILVCRPVQSGAARPSQYGRAELQFCVVTERASRDNTPGFVGRWYQATGRQLGETVFQLCPATEIIDKTSVVSLLRRQPPGQAVPPPELTVGDEEIRRAHSACEADREASVQHAHREEALAARNEHGRLLDGQSGRQLLCTTDTLTSSCTELLLPTGKAACVPAGSRVAHCKAITAAPVDWLDEESLKTLESSRSVVTIGLAPAIPGPSGAAAAGALHRSLPPGSIPLLEVPVAKFGQSNGAGEGAVWRGFEAGQGCRRMLPAGGRAAVDKLYVGVLERHRRQQYIATECDTLVVIATDASGEAITTLQRIVASSGLQVFLSLC